ncbi:11929_t:CDS:2, partial [Gigaspora rosea]
IVNPEDIIDSKDIIESNEIIDSNTFVSNEDFISLSKNFGSVRKEAITNHMLKLCCKISVESKIIYSQTVNKKASEEVTEVSAYKAVLVTDYFDKAILLSEKTKELYKLPYD